MAVFGYPEYKLVAENGLVTNDNFLMTWNKNLVLGTDQIGEVASAKFVYVEVEKDANDTLYFIGAWKIGAAIKFDSEMVIYKAV